MDVMGATLNIRPQALGKVIANVCNIACNRAYSTVLQGS